MKAPRFERSKWPVRFAIGTRAAWLARLPEAEIVDIAGCVSQPRDRGSKPRTGTNRRPPHLGGPLRVSQVLTTSFPEILATSR